MIGIRSAISIRARGQWPLLEAVYMTAPRSVRRNTKKPLPRGGRPYMTERSSFLLSWEAAEPRQGRLASEAGEPRQVRQASAQARRKILRQIGQTFRQSAAGLHLLGHRLHLFGRGHAAAAKAPAKTHGLRDAG